MEYPSPLHRSMILHCITGLGPGGAERMLVQTLPALTEFAHVVICLQNEGIIGKKLEEMGIRVFYTSPWRAIFTLHRIAREINPSLLITYLPMADLLGKIFGKYLGIPIVICSLRSTMRDWRYIPYLILEGLTARYADHYIAVSNAVKTRFVKFGVPANMITVIPNGISLVEIESVKRYETKTLVLKEFNITPNTLIIGVVGGLRKERGHACLLRAFAKALPKLSEQSYLLIIGDGPERKALIAKTRRLHLENVVHFLGFRNDVLRLLPACDIAISSSPYEGMSNALLEAMAAGCAIIATDVPENREIITHNVSGFLVQPKSPTDLSNAITTMAKNPKLRATMGKAAMRRAHAFTLEHTLQNLRKFLRQYTMRS